MPVLQQFLRLLCRFRYPVSLPEEVAQALGITLSNFLSFKECLKRVTSPGCCPKRLRKLMTREEAEAAFSTARRKDCFRHSTLCSYYFNDGCLEFELHFDPDSLLRRIYVRHQSLPQERGVELPLMDPNYSLRPQISNRYISKVPRMRRAS